MTYHLEGRLLEVCDCRVLCPCWIGEEPDNGTCDSVLAYHFDAGTIDGVDVTGRTIAIVSHIPGNVLNGNFRVALYLDEGTSDLQQEALLNVYGGKLGGPVAELAKLIGEVVSVERGRGARSGETAATPSAASSPPSSAASHRRRGLAAELHHPPAKPGRSRRSPRSRSIADDRDSGHRGFAPRARAPARRWR